MTYSADGQALLDAAKAALPDVKRAYVAAGPGTAITCEQIIVHPELVDPKRQPVSRDFPGGCAYMPTAGWRVIYARDCYPMAEGEGRSVKLPDPDAMTTWTLAYVDRVERVVNALLDLSLAGDCENMSVGLGNYVGPLTGVAWVTIPVSIGPAGMAAS